MNTRTIFLVSFLAFGASVFVHAADNPSQLSCDFSEGIPAGFTLVDGDGLEPSDDMAALGFAVGTPWIATLADTEGNMAACSTSWYKNAGTSDDWMITPAVDILNDKYILSWKAKANDKDYRDGYRVYISTTGGSRADFDGLEPVLEIAKETFSWTDREVSLAEYAGKTIYVAFVNNSKDKCYLFIDDLVIGLPASFDISHNLGRVYDGFGSFSICGTLSASRGEAINGFNVKYRIGDYEGECVFDQTVKAGQSFDFTIPDAASLNKFETAEYSILVESGNSAVAEKGRMSAYPHVIVAEEITGGWCGWCVGGIYIFNQMRQTNPDDFIGIAIHSQPGDWKDAMKEGVEDYLDWVINQFSLPGYPHCVVNRNLLYKGNPFSIPDSFASIKFEKKNACGLDLSCEFDPASQSVSACATAMFAADELNSDYGLVYVLVENDVHKDYDDPQNPAPNGYEQNNYYAGGVYGELGGFENMPSTIPATDMWFQDVARAVYPSPYDKIDLVKGKIQDGDSFSNEFSFTLPENVLVPEKTELVAMLINKNGMVANAAKAPLFALSAVNDITDTPGPDDDAWYTISGIRVDFPANGLYIHNGKKVLIRK